MKDENRRFVKRYLRHASAFRHLLVVASAVVLAAFITYIFTYSPTGSDALADLILKTVQIVRPAPGQNAVARGRLVMPVDKVEQLKRGEYTTIDGTELLSLKNRPPGFLFVTITPEDLQGDDFDKQFFLMRKMVDTAVRLRADVVVDASIGDHFHTYPNGLVLAKELRSNGIRRFVIFDGGHHVAGLPLEADCLLIPITDWQGKLFLDHAFTRDAIELSVLRSVMAKEEIESYLALFPRLSVSAKTPSGMGGLARQAILAANATGDKPTSKPIDVTRAAGRSVERRGAVFTSVEMPEQAPAELAAERVNDLVSAATEGRKARRVYLGLTYGVSQFYRTDSSPVEKQANVIELLKPLGTPLDVLSQPISGTDIYTRKLFHIENSLK